MTWASLGRTGRDFVAGTPTADQISGFTGRRAMDPVRAYAGLEVSDDVRERAQVAVEELQTLGGFDRDVLDHRQHDRQRMGRRPGHLAVGVHVRR